MGPKFWEFCATFMKYWSSTRKTSLNGSISHAMIVRRRLEPFLMVFDFLEFGIPRSHAYPVHILPKLVHFEFDEKQIKHIQRIRRFV